MVKIDSCHVCRDNAHSIPGDKGKVKSHFGFLPIPGKNLLDEANSVRYAVAMESHTIRLKEPLIIPKALDENFLFMVDSSLAQFWPQIVRLCEKEKLTLQEVTGQMAILDPLHLGMPDWYFYKMRCLLRAYFLGDEMAKVNVEVAGLSSVMRYTAYETREVGQCLLARVQLG